MAKGCSKFKFIVAVFFFPWRAFLERLGIRYDLPAIVNAHYREAFTAIPPRDKAVILPHCLVGQMCKARFSKEDGILCVTCKNCRCGEIRLLCQDRGWRFYISPSSGFTKRLAQRKGIRAAVGVACDSEIAKGIRSTPVTVKGVRLKKSKVIPQMLLSGSYNCLENDIDWEGLRALIAAGDGPIDKEEENPISGEGGSTR